MKIKTILSSLILAITFIGSVYADETVNPPATTQVTDNKTIDTTFIGEKLNINTASANEIQKALVGIGAKKAEAIVEYREQHGKFIAPEQLLEVKGIGKAIFEKNKDRIDLSSFNSNSQ
ncbi:helix-hairpin-helix domain-containing protein [Avibacterium paragallinarum]|uniref:ComEA family DNA-binding protein n=1 Tax=Avibacterium paragallinarum TaxID=728 RepID=UPI0021F7F84E|nr:helix-hairpin-helix domain-containing protein [Avibacterium paragallinarum]UXN37310.1 helix-hairpin-helix domain-containing protein [Avibacterium paragallinarum]